MSYLVGEKLVKKSQLKMSVVKNLLITFLLFFDERSQSVENIVTFSRLFISDGIIPSKSNLLGSRNVTSIGSLNGGSLNGVLNRLWLSLFLAKL